MQFGINWNDGYEVTVLMVGEHGYLRHFTLRNFGEHQGDARIFKEADCPNLTDAQIRMLIKNYAFLKQAHPDKTLGLTTIEDYEKLKPKRK